MKAFIGPLGDDIPSIIAILLALSLFFAGVTYALNAFNEKSNSMSAMKASIEMSRAATSKVLLKNPIEGSVRDRVDYIAKSYGVDFNKNTDIFFEGAGSCQPRDYIIKQLVPSYAVSINNIELKTLVICVRKNI